MAVRKSWQLQDAKNRFSEVVERATVEGPQTVTRRGREVVVIVAAEEYRQLLHPRVSFKQFLRKAPLQGVDLERDRDTGRDRRSTDIE